jgi:segregation and condensation protein B
MTDEAPALPPEPDSVAEPEIGGEGWSGSDIEEAYLKALHAMEEVAWEEGDVLPGVEPDAATHGSDSSVTLPDAPPALAESAPASDTTPPGSDRPTEPPLGSSASAAGPRLAKGTQRSPAEEIAQHSNVTPTQVIEAALFVGGAPLTARKIAALLRGSSDAAFVERTIEELNDAYAAEGRPYEIRLGDGGYRLELRAEYDRLRHRVYGSGPREVKLAQDALEVLALVAYQQPISQPEIESHGKQTAGNLLRQLLRRDLIRFERGPGGRKDLQYHTTARFLSVFGIGSLDELPQAEDLAKK